MNPKFLHKVISFALIFCILLPLGVGFIHSTQDHEHDICKAKTEKHIHSKKNNCLSFHYITNFQYWVQIKNLETAERKIINTPSAQLNSLFCLIHISSNLERGPPPFDVF